MGVLRSAATRQPGYVLLTDVAPTVAAWATGVRHPTWAAEPWTVQPDDAPAAARVAAVADHADAARLVQPVALAFWPTWALTQLLACLVVGLLCRRADPDRRGRLLRGLSRGVVAMSCVPAATYLAGLVPWWRGGAVALWLVIYAFAGSLAAVALLGPWRRRPFGPPAAVAALTALTVGGDAVTGSHLTLSTLLGEQPTVAGRFYGLGNVAFSLLATATLLVMVAVAGHDRRAGRPRRGALLAGLVGLAAVAVDGLPTWGADLGGPIALLPAVVVFVLVALGLRLTWSRVLGIGLVTALAVTALAVADYLRPAGSRSHLGRFVQTLGDGAPPTWSPARPPRTSRCCSPRPWPSWCRSGCWPPRGSWRGPTRHSGGCCAPATSRSPAAHRARLDPAGVCRRLRHQRLGRGHPRGGRHRADPARGGHRPRHTPPASLTPSAPRPPSGDLCCARSPATARPGPPEGASAELPGGRRHARRASGAAVVGVGSVAPRGDVAAGGRAISGRAGGAAGARPGRAGRRGTARRGGAVRASPTRSPGGAGRTAPRAPAARPTARPP